MATKSTPAVPENPFLVLEAKLQKIEDLILSMKESSIPAKEPESDIMTINQVCEMLGYNKYTVYAKTSAEELPFYKPKGSKKLYFSRTAIEKWIKNGMAGTT